MRSTKVEVIEVYSACDFKFACERFRGWNLQSSYCGEKVWKGVFIKEDDDMDDIVDKLAKENSQLRDMVINSMPRIPHQFNEPHAPVCANVSGAVRFECPNPDKIGDPSAYIPVKNRNGDVND